MALSRSPNPLYPYVYERRVPKLGIRDLLILTLGAIDEPLNTSHTFTLLKTLSNHLENEIDIQDITRTDFKAMLKKLKLGKIIQSSYDTDSRGFKIYLTPLGLGELDGILFSRQYVVKKWNRFREFAKLAAV